MSQRRARIVKTVINGSEKYFSMMPVMMKNHILKVSSNEDGNILVIGYNLFTFQTFIKYFTDEIQANQYIQSWLDSPEPTPE